MAGGLDTGCVQVAAAPDEILTTAPPPVNFNY